MTARPRAVPAAAVAADALLGDADVSTNRFRTPLSEIAAMAPEAQEEDLEAPLSDAAASETSPKSGPKPMPVYAAPPRPKGPSWPERIRSGVSSRGARSTRAGSGRWPRRSAAWSCSSR